MWNTFISENETYIIKISHFSSYNMILSNFIFSWSEELSTDDIVNRSKELNPLISTDNDTFIKMVLSITNKKITADNIDLVKNDSNLRLEYKTEVESIPFKFIFHLKLTSGVSLCREIVVPAIQTIQYLEKRQQEICELLRKKDEEIQQHVFENGNIKRVDIVTEKFNESIFHESTSKTLCCNLFSNSDEFNKTLIAKYGCAEPELLTTKKEEKKIHKNKVSVAKQILKSKKIKLKKDIKTKSE